MIAIPQAIYHESVMQLWDSETIDENWMATFDEMISEYKKLVASDSYNEKYKWGCISEYAEIFDLHAEVFGEDFKSGVRKQHNLLFQNAYAYLKTLAVHFPDELKKSLKILNTGKGKLEKRIIKYQDFHDDLLVNTKLLGNFYCDKIYFRK